MMQLGKFFDRVNNNNNTNNNINNNEYVYGENLTIDNKLSLRMKNEEHFDKINTNYHVKYKNTSVYDNEINIIKTTKKQNKVQQKLMKNNRTTIETSTIIPRQDFESLVSYGNFNTSINSEKESPLDTSIHSSSNGFFKLIFFISIIFIILLLIASIIYIWAIKRYSTNLEHINRRLPEVDHNLLNHSILDLEALMLSVQNLGCAGMERLGNPPSSNSMLASLPSQRDNRSIRHSSIPVMQHDLINSTNGESQSFFKESKSQQLTSGIKYSSHNNGYTNCKASANCQMRHIPRPDGDFGRDTLSNHQYHAETTRSYIQAPPNKSIEDVPDASLTAHQLKFINTKNCPKSSLKGSDNRKVTEKFKGFFKTISGGTNSNSNPLKSGTDLKTNSNVFTGAMYLSSSKSSNNFPCAPTTSSLRGTTHLHHQQQQQQIATSHDKMTEILKSNDASSTNKMQTSNCINSKEVEEKSISGTSSIQSSSSTTHIDYSSL